MYETGGRGINYMAILKVINQEEHVKFVINLSRAPG